MSTATDLNWIASQGKLFPQISTLEAVTVSLARTEDELWTCFRILYEAYHQAGLVESNDIGLRLTPYHILPTTEVFVACHRGEVNSTLTLAADGKLGLPMDAMYGEETTWLRSRGFRLAEIGSLADRRNSTVHFVRSFKVLAKLVVQVAETRGVDGLVIATHPRHAGFYIRSFGFTQIGGLTNCPYAKGNPAVALLLDFKAVRGTQFETRLFHPKFEAAALEKTSWSTETLERLSARLNQLFRP